MLGEKELIKIFPDFADLVQPSGIDLELDKIYVQKSGGSLIDNEKTLPEIEELEGDIYTLKPHRAYLASIKREMVKKVSEVVAEAYDLPVDAITVLVQGYNFDDIGVAGELLSDRK